MLRREFLAALALAAPPVRAAAEWNGAESLAGLRYAGCFAAHDAPLKAPGAPLLGITILPPAFDRMTGLPSYDLIARVADQAAARGATWLIVNGRPSYDGRLDRGALTEKCIGLNKTGRLCAAKRLRLAYRNQQAEFGGNALEMEMLVLRTNPELVNIAMDAAPAMKAGADPSNFLARHLGRVECIFVRDLELPGYAALAREIAVRGWQGWLVQSPATAEARRALTRIFRV